MTKIKRILSAAIIAAMALSVMAVPVSANTTTLGGATIVYSQDFESYATGQSSLTRDTIYDAPTPIVHFGHEIYAGTDYGHSNSATNKVLLLSKDHANKGAAQILTDTVKTSGKYKLTYKLYPANGGNQLVIDDKTDFASIATRTNGDCPHCLWVFNLNNSTLTRQWYDVELTVDLDNDTETVNIYPEGSRTVAYTRTQNYYANLGIIEFAQAANGPAGRDNSARIDDVKFYEIVSAVEPDYIYKQDFDGYGSAQELTRDVILDAPEPIVHYGHKVWAGTYGHSDVNDKTLVLCKDLNGRGAAQILTDTVKTSGKYMLKYKLYPANGNNILVIDDKTDYATVDVRTNANCPNCLWAFNVTTSTLPRQWYDVELTVDLDNDTETVNIYEEGSGTVLYTRTQNYYANLGIFEFAQSNNGSGEANSARIDDIEFYEVYDSAPVLTSANVKCYAGDDLQADLGNISPFTDSIEITFPQKIKGDTLTSNNIYLTDGSDNRVAVTSQVVDGKVCVLVPTGALTAGTTYTLHIENLTNTSGQTMSSAFSQSLTVSAGNVYSRLKSIEVGGNEVIALSQLTAGANLTVNYSVRNSTSSAQDTAVLVAYYNVVNDIPELVSVEVESSTVAANTNAGSLTKTFTVPTQSFNHVMVMLWDSMSSMRPLSDTIELGSN